MVTRVLSIPLLVVRMVVLDEDFGTEGSARWSRVHGAVRLTPESVPEHCAARLAVTV